VKPFHVCNPGHASRAFVKPRGFLNRVYLWCRGWRPHYLGPLWQKGRPYLAPPVVVVGTTHNQGNKS
jgi:hypothetical protein